MTLTLDHIQRLNLHALLGAQRGDVATIRALWALQDKLGLTPDEEKAIELQDRKSTRLNSSHSRASRMPSSA